MQFIVRPVSYVPPCSQRRRAINNTPPTHLDDPTQRAMAQALSLASLRETRGTTVARLIAACSSLNRPEAVRTVRRPAGHHWTNQQRLLSSCRQISWLTHSHTRGEALTGARGGGEGALTGANRRRPPAAPGARQTLTAQRQLMTMNHHL